MLKAGKIRLLALYDDKRFNEFPDVPNLLELGYPEAILPGIAGFYIHKDTPQDAKNVLFDVCKKVYAEPEFKKGINMLNADPLWGDPEFLTEKIEKAKKTSIPLLKELGMYAGK